MAKRRDVKHKLAKGGRTALAAILTLMVSGLPASVALAEASPEVRPQADARPLVGLIAQPPKLPDTKASSPAGAALAAAVDAAKTQTVEPMLELRQALQDLQNTPGRTRDLSKIEPRLSAAYQGESLLKNALEGVGAQLTPNDNASEAYFAVMLAYYSYKGLLATAAEAMGQSASVTPDTIAGLDLVLPAKPADMVAGLESQWASDSGLEVYDIPMRSIDAGNGKKRLEVTAREAAKFRMGAFMAFPSDATAKRALVFQALKISFAQQATIKSFMYHDEIPDQSLPAGTDPAIVALQTQADAITHEGVYRSYVTTALLQPVSDAVAAARPNFNADVHALYQKLADDMSDQVDLPKFLSAAFIPKEISDVLKDDDAGGRDAAYRKAIDILADQFLDMEKGNRAVTIRNALQSSPLYLTEMTRDDLRSAIGEATRFATKAMLLVPLDVSLFDEDQLNQKQNALILSKISTLADHSFKNDSISDEVLDQFVKSRENFDAITSWRRYGMAQKILAAVDWLELANKDLAKVQDGVPVPEDIIPPNPNVGEVLLAMKSMQSAPAWALELLQSLGAKADTVSAQDDLNNLDQVVRAMPTQVYSLAQDAKAHATNGVLGEIQAAQKHFVTLDVYKWRSLDERLRILGQHVRSPSGRQVLSDFLRIDHLIDLVQSTSLRDAVREAFDQLADRKTSKLAALIDTALRGKSFIARNRELLQHIFGPQDQRATYLRGILGNPAVFRNYISVGLQDMQNNLPILFTAVPLSSRLKSDVDNPNPIPFHELVSRLKKAVITTRADIGLGQDALGSLSDDLLRKDGILEEPARSAISPERLIDVALGNTRDDESVEGKVLDWILGLIKRKTKPPVFMSDSYWPTQFLVRDVMPAYVEGNSASLYDKTMRIVVSAMLEPYLRSAAEAGKFEQKTLLDPANDNTDALLQSESYRQIVALGGDEVGGRLSDMQRDATTSERRWQTLKRYTAKTQDVSNILFYETLFLDMSAQIQVLSSIFMLASQDIDRVADYGLLADYVDTFSEMRPFAYSNVFGAGLYSHSELEQIRREVHDMAESIVMNLPNDLFFNLAMASDGYQYARQLLMQKRMAAAGNQLDMAALGDDLEKLAKAYENVNLDLGVKPEQFERLYQKRTAALAPQIETSVKARTEYDYWQEAHKLSQEVNTKYAQVFAAMAQASVGAPKKAPEKKPGAVSNSSDPNTQTKK